MGGRFWCESQNGLFEIVSITPDTLEGAMNIMRRSFFVDENICIGVELQKHPEAAVELEELCVIAARDGVSLVAVQKSTREVVGVVFNNLEVKPDGDETYYNQYAPKFKHESSKCLVHFLNEATAIGDLHALTQSECILEIMCVGVLPEFRRQGLARNLVATSIKVAKALYSGECVKVPIDDEPLPIKPVPAIVSAVMTSIATQNLAKDFGFVKVADISYDNFSFEGTTFASRIGPDTPFSTIVYFALNQ